LRTDGSPARNGPRDVKVVQFLFNEIPGSAGAPADLLPVNGVLTQETLDGIASFQQQHPTPKICLMPG
jgi:Ni,Fe-hydrogenase III small subunit